MRLVGILDELHLSTSDLIELTTSQDEDSAAST